MYAAEDGALPGDPGASVDVVDDVHFLGEALREISREQRFPWRLSRAESSWISYIADPGPVGSVVIIRAGLADHVPTHLKVRALLREGVRVLVLVGSELPSAYTSRLTRAGAVVLTPADDLGTVLDAIAGVSVPGPAEVVTSDVRLSDRELQCACLYASPSAPSAAVLAKILGLPLASVRTHIQRARTTLRAVGDTSTRSALRSVLISDGWLEPY